MTDFPLLPPFPLHVHSFTRWGAGWQEARTQGGLSITSGTWPVANTAFYLPAWVPWPYPVRRVFWINGNTAAGNMDFGIYSQSGSLLYSTGSTALSGATSVQYTTPSPDFLLSPGQYYFALACNNNTAGQGGQAFAAGTVVHQRLAGVLQEASAFPLPVTMTPAASSNLYLPICGVTYTTTGF